ncbi:MAG: hypothetical protein BAJALOKI3v1_240009 [Promethearchaeota archaeon]|nr:MAG: hypothetical protein BAJALOKI3v1_240009 [Candidatus Lokiarchaeota archaeon]
MSKIDIDELLKILPKLIRENDTVKGAIISALSGVVATHDDIVKLTDSMDKRFEHMDKRFEFIIDQMEKRTEQVDKRFEQMDKRFEQVDKRFEQMDKRFEQVDKRFEQVDKRFEQVNKRFEQVDKRFEQVNKRFEQVDKRFESLINLVNTGFTEARKDRDSLRIAIYSISSRGGEKLETLILNMLSDKLLQENIEKSDIARQVLIDRQGEVYFENYSTDVDIVIKDGKTFLMEVKSTADNRDIFDLQKKGELYNKLTEKEYDGLILACLEINRANFELAIKQDVHIIAGAII